MKIYSVCSSSRGNCTYIKYQNQAVLIDVGISASGLSRALTLAQLDLKEVQGIFLTHEHVDHVKGLHAVSKEVTASVYATRGTLEKVVEKGLVEGSTVLREISQRSTAVGDMKITPFHTMHDCADGLGYTIEAGGKKVAICTDLGVMTEDVAIHLNDCDFILLESNYDPNMLEAGKYPYAVKRRIASDYGHLSNQQCAVQLQALIGQGVNRFLLGHLSQANNTPALAMQTSMSYLTIHGMQFGKDYQLEVAPVQSIGKVISL